MNSVGPPRNDQIAGYDFGNQRCARSPVTEEELRCLEQATGWTADDERLLQKHAASFAAQAEAMVDSWRAVIAAQSHLARWFIGADGKPDEEYKARVKRRFVRWVVDVATRPHDRDWLDYQEEIGLRHTPAKKNKADSAQTPELVPLRYLLAFVPVVLPIRRFFERTIPDDDELTRLEQAWSRAVHLHISLWARPYAKDGLW